MPTVDSEILELIGGIYDAALDASGGTTRSIVFVGTSASITLEWCATDENPWRSRCPSIFPSATLR